MSKYIRPSEEGPQVWTVKLCSEYARFLLKMREDPLINVSTICGHKGRYNTAYKALKDIGLVASAKYTTEQEIKRGSRYETTTRDSYLITINVAKFNELGTGMAQKPSIDRMEWHRSRDRYTSAYTPISSTKDAYTSLVSLSPNELLWVYFHKDEYDFTTRAFDKYDRMVCFPKADLPALANAIYTARVIAYLKNHHDFQMEITLGMKFKRIFSDANDYSRMPWLIDEGTINEKGVDEKAVTEELLTEKIAESCKMLREGRKALKELVALRKALRGVDAYQSKYVDMVKKHLSEEGFLYVNTEDKDLKELITIALEGTFEGYPIL